MTPSEIRESFGEEYPEAITFNGIRMVLVTDGRFSRTYSSSSHCMSYMLNRIQVEGVDFSLEQLETEWPGWSDSERLDFCNSCSCFWGRPDFADMLRIVMNSGDPVYIATTASSVAARLPTQEAYAFLEQALQESEGDSENIVQAIAQIGQPGAIDLVRRHLERAWSRRGLMLDHFSQNRNASEAVVTIKYLIVMGAPASEFEAKARLLASHPCKFNRDLCSFNLRDFFGWLPEPTPHELNLRSGLEVDSASGAIVRSQPEQPNPDPEYADECDAALLSAFQFAANRRHESVSLEHLLAGLLNDASVQGILIDMGADLSALRSCLTNRIDDRSPIAESMDRNGPAMDDACGDVLGWATSFVRWHASTGSQIEGTDCLLALFDRTESRAVDCLSGQGIFRQDFVKRLASKYPGLSSGMFR